MKQPNEDNKQKKRRKTLHSLCSVSALLLSVVCCMALIHVELRIQEHYQLISHSVTVCDQMETQILRKLQQNYERWQVTKANGLKGHLQGTNGKEKFYKISAGFDINISLSQILAIMKIILVQHKRSFTFKICCDYPLRIRNKSTGL